MCHDRGARSSLLSDKPVIRAGGYFSDPLVFHGAILGGVSLDFRVELPAALTSIHETVAEWSAQANPSPAAGWRTGRRRITLTQAHIFSSM
jgi:hypothetical protein